MGFVVATNRGVLGKHAAGEWNEGTNQSCHSSHRSPFRGRLAFGFLEPVLGFTREQVVRNEVDPGHEVLKVFDIRFARKQLVRSLAPGLREEGDQRSSRSDTQEPLRDALEAHPGLEILDC